MSLREVGGVFGVAYLLTYAVNYAGLAVMGGKGLREAWRQRTATGSLRAAMQTRTFWVAFDVSGMAVIANTLMPLVLLPFAPVWVVLGATALNALFNLPSVPFRLWLWRVHANTTPVA